MQCEWKAKYSQEGDDELNILESLGGYSVQVPLQTNYFDCGIYLLQYVENFFSVSSKFFFKEFANNSLTKLVVNCILKKPIEDYSIPINLENWFPTSLIKQKRQSIKKILLDLETKFAKTKLVPQVKAEPADTALHNIEVQKQLMIAQKHKELTESLSRKCAVEPMDFEDGPPLNPITSQATKKLKLCTDFKQEKAKMMDDMDQLI